MSTIIRLKIRKDVDPSTEKIILKLKGQLIAQSFTDLIHYDDADENNYIHYFTTEAAKKQLVISYIASYIQEASLTEAVSLL
jgi:hypothetical protein